MAFILPSLARGHSSFHGTTTNDASPALADALDKDSPGAQSFLLLPQNILISADIFTPVQSIDTASIAVPVRFKQVNNK